MVEEHFVDQRVTYTLQVDGEVVIVENVPARVCLDTGEPYFAPKTVERLQELVLRRRAPDRFIQTPVFKFAA